MIWIIAKLYFHMLVPDWANGGGPACAGIEGELVPSPRPPTKHSKEGTYQQIVLGKINWKIP